MAGCACAGLIVEYLVERYGRGHLAPPQNTPAHLQWKYWLHYSEGSAMTPLLLSLFARKISSGSPWFLYPIMSFISKSMMTGFVNGGVWTA